MQDRAKQYYTEEEYLALESASEEKREYYRGKIFAMAGGALNHAIIALNAATALKKRLPDDINHNR